MNVMDKSQFNNPLTNPVCISRVTLPIINLKKDPLCLFYIGVDNEVHFYALPISIDFTQEQASAFVEKAIRYIKLEYSKQYALITRLEPGDSITLHEVDELMKKRKESSTK